LSFACPACPVGPADRTGVKFRQDHSAGVIYLAQSLKHFLLTYLLMIIKKIKYLLAEYSTNLSAIEIGEVRIWIERVR
jgi:hypothetical protein